MFNTIYCVNSTTGGGTSPIMPITTIPVTTSTATTTTNSSNAWYSNWVNPSASVVCPTTPAQQQGPQFVEYIPDHIRLEAGKSRTISFPDGTIIDFKLDGSFEINDKNAKVVYRANRSHDFNPFINASDKLEEFIKFCGEIGVRQGDMLNIPIKQFVQWLVIEAARADGDKSIPLELPDLTKPRCRTCQRFISRKLKADGIEFCRPVCLEAKLKKHTGAKHGYQSEDTTYEAAARNKIEAPYDDIPF
jgi:hypothetical protein